MGKNKKKKREGESERGRSSLAAQKVGRDHGQTPAVPPAPHLDTAFAREILVFN